MHPSVDLFLSSHRFVVAEAERRGWVETCERAGVTLMVDACTYWSGILDDRTGVIMTSSAKWAYYAPQNLHVRVAFGSLEECVDSAVEGRVVRDARLWGDDLWAG